MFQLLPALLGTIGGPLLQGMGVGAGLGLGAGALGAGVAGITSLLQGNDILTAGLDAFGGFGGASGLGSLAKSGQAATAAGAASAGQSAGTAAAQSLIDDAARAGQGLMQINPSTLAAGYQAAAAPASASFLGANPSAGFLDAAGAGLKDLVSPGGMGRFAAATGESALSSLGLPAAGLALQGSGAFEPPQMPGQYSLDLGPFTPLAEVREQNREDRMGYASGGTVQTQTSLSDIRNRMRGRGAPAQVDPYQARYDELYAKLKNPKLIQDPMFRNALGGLSAKERNEFNKLRGFYGQRRRAYAGGGMVAFADGGMANMGGIQNLLQNLNRPQQPQQTQPYTLTNPMQGQFDSRRVDSRRVTPEYGEQVSNYKKGGYLDGPGDGMSDSIKATIEGKQPARLADGEFVVPADVVSHLGNGSTKAGAKRLYSMMDKVRKARTGTTKQGKQIKAEKYLPA